MSVRLTIITPSGSSACIDCDSVTLTARDNAEGEGGGSIGVMRGHVPALIALSKDSRVTARTGSERAVYTVAGGFASVGADSVCVTTEEFSGPEKA